jgi:O-methyltransferase
VLKKASPRIIAKYLRDFSGHRLEQAFFWAPPIQKLIQRRRWRTRPGVMLVDVEQLRPKLRDALAYLTRNGREGVGDYLEFGVFQGTSMICMYEVLKEMNLDHVRLFGFDSFEGMPDVASTDDDGHWQPGQFAAPYELTKERLSAAGVPENRAVLIKGWFSDTLSDETIARYGIVNPGVIMIDADIYTSSKQALDYCAPLIQYEAVLFMDDWYANEGRLVQRNMGQPRALKEFLAENPHFQTTDLGRYSFFGRPAGNVFTLKRLSAQGKLQPDSHTSDCRFFASTLSLRTRKNRHARKGQALSEGCQWQSGRSPEDVG